MEFYSINLLVLQIIVSQFENICRGHSRMTRKYARNPNGRFVNRLYEDNKEIDLYMRKQWVLHAAYRRML